MTQTIYLRFPDEAAAKQALAPYVDPGGNWITASHEHALDPVGTIYAPGTLDGQGNQLTLPVAQAGWHVNLQGAVPEAASAYIITPATPRRVFA
jgi:hypothetical protein